MTAPLRTVKFREYRAACVLLTLVCGHATVARDDSAQRCSPLECTT